VNKAITIEEYIALQADDKRAVIDKMRALIKECVPKAQEKISFRMPAYCIGKEVLVYFHTHSKDSLRALSIARRHRGV